MLFISRINSKPLSFPRVRSIKTTSISVPIRWISSVAPGMSRAARTRYPHELRNAVAVPRKSVLSSTMRITGSW